MKIYRAITFELSLLHFYLINQFLGCFQFLLIHFQGLLLKVLYYEPIQELQVFLSMEKPKKMICVILFVSIMDHSLNKYFK